MIWLVLGLLLWSGTHFVPSLFRGARTSLIARAGEQPYKGLFSLSLVLAIVLMVVGWRGTMPGGLYQPPPWSTWVTNVLMFVALLLFVASGVPTNIKRLLRHPQLTGVATWAAAHLLSNGTDRAVLLFGGLGAWAIGEMVAINHRDGAWQKPEALPMTADLKPLIGAIVVFAVLQLVHPWIAGVSALPR